MLYFCKNIKNTQSVISAVKIFYNKNDFVCISRGKSLEFYNKSYERIYTIKTHVFVTYLSSIVINNISNLFLYTIDHQYAILRDDDIIFKGRIEISTKVKHLVSDGKKIVIVYDNNTVKVLHIRKGNVVIDNFKELKYLDILDVKFFCKKLIFLVKDYDSSTAIYFYKEKFELEEKRAVKSKKLITYKDQLILLKENIITIVKNDENINLDFANPHLLYSCEVSSGVILSMRNGEIFFISVLEPKIKFLGKVKSSLDSILHIKSNIYLGSSVYGPSIIFSLEPFEVINSFENISCIRNLNFNTKLHFLSGIKNNNSFGALSYGIPIKIDREIKLSENITKFWIFKKFIIVSFSDHSIIYDKNIKEWQKTEEIINLHIFNDHCYFNTSSNLYEFSSGADLKSTPIEKCILSSFYENKMIIYTENNRLEIYLLDNISIIKTLNTQYQISFILFDSLIYISTYNNEFIIYDQNFNEQKFELETIISGFLNNNNLIGSTLDGKIMLYNIKTLENTILCDFNTPLIIHKSKEGYITTGEVPLFISKDFNCYYVFVKNISCSFSDENIFISKKNFIYKIKKELKPKYKISIKRIKQEGTFLLSLPEINRSIVSYPTVKKIYNKNESIEEGKKVIEKKNNIINNRIDANLIMYFNSKKIDCKILEDLIPMDGKIIKDFLLVGFNNNKEKDSKLILFSIKNLEIVYETCLDNILFSLDICNEYIAVGTVSSLILYKLQGNILVRLSKSETQIAPQHLYFKNNIILVSDSIKNFSLYKIDLEINDLMEEKRADKNISSMSIIYNKNIIISSLGKIYMCKNYFDTSPYLRFSIIHNQQETITSFDTGTLSVNKKYNNLYYSTEIGEINMIFSYSLKPEEEKDIEKVYQDALKECIFDIENNSVIEFDILQEYNRRVNLIDKGIIDAIKKVH